LGIYSVVKEHPGFAWAKPPTTVASYKYYYRVVKRKTKQIWDVIPGTSGIARIEMMAAAEMTQEPRSSVSGSFLLIASQRYFEVYRGATNAKEFRRCFVRTP